MNTPRHELTFSQLTKLNCPGWFVQSTNGELLYQSYWGVLKQSRIIIDFKVACFPECRRLYDGSVWGASICFRCTEVVSLPQSSLTNTTYFSVEVRPACVFPRRLTAALEHRSEWRATVALTLFPFGLFLEADKCMQIAWRKCNLLSLL